MIKFYTAMTAAMFISQTAISDDFSEENDRTDSPIVECLNSLSRACAFETAMRVAIAEKLSIERAKVLTAVGRAMAETGKPDDARMTLNMALEEARLSKISFAVDAKIMEIAPILAMIGDIDRAVELAASVQTLNGRDRILSLAADMVAEQGDVSGARKISEAVENRQRAIWIALSAMRTLVHQGSTQGLNEFADSILPDVEALKRPSDKLLAMVRLAMAYKAGGNSEKALMLQAQTDEIKNSFASYSLKARVAAAQLEYTSAGEDVDSGSRAYVEAIAAEKRIRGHLDKSSITDEMGPALAFSGYTDHAVGYVRYYQETLEKSNYLKKVARLSDKNSNSALASAVRETLVLTQEIENGFEADEVRMNLLFAARSIGDLKLARDVTLTMQDDDNAAKALALLIPLL